MHRHLASQSKKRGRETREGTRPRGKRETPLDSSNSLSLSQKSGSKTLEDSTLTAKSELKLDLSAPFSQFVNSGLWTLDKKRGKRTIGSDSTTLLSQTRENGERKSRVSEWVNSNKSRSSSPSSGKSLQKKKQPGSKRGILPEPQSFSKRLQIDTKLEEKRETLLQSKTQHLDSYLQSYSQFNFLAPFQSHNLSLFQPQNLSLLHSPSQFLLQAAAHSQVESRSSDGSDARGRMAGCAGGSSLTDGRSSIQTRGRKMVMKNAFQPDRKHGGGSSVSSLVSRPSTSVKDKTWMKNEQASDSQFQDGIQLANIRKTGNQSSDSNNPTGTRNTAEKASSQTGSHVAISGERCSGDRHLCAAHRQEMIETKRKILNASGNSNLKQWMDNNEKEEEGQEVEEEKGDEWMTSNTPNHSTYRFLQHIHTLNTDTSTKTHPSSGRLYLHHNILTPLVNQKIRTRDPDNVKTLNDREVRTQTQQEGHSISHQHHHNHHRQRLMTELIGFITPLPSPPPSPLSPASLKPASNKKVGSRQETAKKIIRRSAESEELKSTDKRNSRNGDSSRRPRGKNEEKEEHEDNEEYDEEKEEEEWAKACGVEGEEEGEGPAGRRLGGGSLQSLGSSRVHVAETVVTLRLQDVNDNPPVFPNATMYGQVQENGPICE